MIKILHFAAFAALLSIGAVSSGFTSPATAVEQRQQRTSQSDYNEGYSRGKIETEQNKCIDGAYFQERYVRYHQQATNNLNNATTQSEVDYYQGYLDGMEEGYMTPVQCSSPGSPGSGGGGSGPRCNDGPCPTDDPELP
ncbi:hypothetical protein [Hymenobacter lapidiphilus]|uniref:hypothetical protein n=1 Tax=Hymenobacter sp. CCM 8763 TaxID=2303334 RepID=UPI0011C0F2A6|nr:hypothetical protein [Hymenobacter sp. CCM 8763]